MVIAESGNNNYITQITDGKSGAGIISDVSEAKGGGGGNIGPHELLCAGLASCLNITARMVLDRKELSYDKVITKVDIDTSSDEETVFKYHVEIVGDIDPEVKESIIEKLTRSPVKKTLQKNTRVEWMD